jgi:hypothetical protein
MLKKNGTPMPTQSIDELIFDMSLAFDTDKKVKTAFSAVGKTPAPGFLFLFDKTGVCAQPVSLPSPASRRWRGGRDSSLT